MNANAMLMNNMYNIGMNNNQPIIMDENALKVKNIIQPYEDKIKQLEDIIRQKDFEIAVLKDKLNNIENNNKLQNFMNMNNPMMPNLNQKIENKGNEIIISYGNINEKYNCFENEITYKLLEKIDGVGKWNLLKFTCDGKIINPFITIKENGIKNYSKIDLNPFINIIFNFNNRNIVITLDGNYLFKKAVKYFLLIIGKENCFNNFLFKYNSSQLNIEDKTPIKNIFKFVNVKVYVDEC